MVESQKKISMGNFFRNQLFSVYNTFWNIVNWFPKNFFRIFFRKFSLFGHFRQKMVKSQQKIFNGKFFRHQLFRFKIRFETFWIDSKKKFEILFENFHFLAIFVKKWLSPRKNFQRGNFFRNQLFRFKIRFETFWIDSKKFFFEDFHFLAIFVVNG